MPREIDCAIRDLPKHPTHSVETIIAVGLFDCAHTAKIALVSRPFHAEIAAPILNCRRHASGADTL